MDEDTFLYFEGKVFEELESKLNGVYDKKDADAYIENVAKTIKPDVSKEELKRLVDDATDFGSLEKYLEDEQVEDIMINNIESMFIYAAGQGQVKVKDKVDNRKDLEMLVKKLKMYATTAVANKRIFDVHLPNGSRANIVNSPLGADITIRNFRKQALSIIDLINFGELSYTMGGRLWLYAEGLKVRPANLIIGGMPAAGKTTLLNAMFSFFRPEERIVIIEETYELNSETQENCVRLETSPDVSIEDLVKNSLRMRPDMLVIGEVRGSEAKDMMTAMNIGKICMGTIHASTSRDVVTRLEHTPMDIEKDIIPLIDAIIMCGQVNEGGSNTTRRLTQVSEISGIETQVLLSDLYLFDYKTHRGSEILPSVTYRDTLSKLSGYPPATIIEEERRRAKVLEQLNKMGIRDMRGINEYCKEYYDNPGKAIAKIGLKNLGTLD